MIWMREVAWWLRYRWLNKGQGTAIIQMKSYGCGQHGDMAKEQAGQGRAGHDIGGVFDWWGKGEKARVWRVARFGARRGGQRGTLLHAEVKVKVKVKVEVGEKMEGWVGHWWVYHWLEHARSIACREFSLCMPCTIIHSNKCSVQ